MRSKGVSPPAFLAGASHRETAGPTRRRASTCQIPQKRNHCRGLLSLRVVYTSGCQRFTKIKKVRVRAARFGRYRTSGLHSVES